MCSGTLHSTCEGLVCVYVCVCVCVCVCVWALGMHAARLASTPPPPLNPHAVAPTHARTHLKCSKRPTDIHGDGLSVNRDQGHPNTSCGVDQGDLIRCAVLPKHASRQPSRGARKGQG
jgi:hypothetical protein